MRDLMQRWRYICDGAWHDHRCAEILTVDAINLCDANRQVIRRGWVTDGNDRWFCFYHYPKKKIHHNIKKTHMSMAILISPIWLMLRSRFGFNISGLRRLLLRRRRRRRRGMYEYSADLVEAVFRPASHGVGGCCVRLGWSFTRHE